MELTEKELTSRDSRTVDIFTTPFLYHSTDPRSLKTILEHGILSAAINDHAKLVDEYKEPYSSTINKVFLCNPTQILPLSNRILRDMLYRSSNSSSRIALLVDPQITTEFDMHGRLGMTEVKRKIRIAPRFIKGVLIDEYSQRTDRTKERMAEISTENPKLALPIYTTAGDLIWPRSMTNEEIKKQPHITYNLHAGVIR